MFVGQALQLPDQICHAAPEASIAVHATEHGILGRGDTSRVHATGGTRHGVLPVAVRLSRTTADISGSSVVRGQG